MDQLRSNRPLRFRDAAEMSPSERYLNQAVFEDLRRQRPKLLVVLQHTRDRPSNGFRRLNYLAYFSRDARIASLLEDYQLVANLGDFTVYERVPGGTERSAPPPRALPSTLDIADTRQTLFANPTFVLALLAFVVSAILASIFEKSRASAAVAPERA